MRFHLRHQAYLTVVFINQNHQFFFHKLVLVVNVQIQTPCNNRKSLLNLEGFSGFVMLDALTINSLEQ